MPFRIPAFSHNEVTEWRETRVEWAYDLFDKLFRCSQNRNQKRPPNYSTRLHFFGRQKPTRPILLKYGTTYTLSKTSVQLHHLKKVTRVPATSNPVKCFIKTSIFAVNKTNGVVFYCLKKNSTRYTTCIK